MLSHFTLAKPGLKLDVQLDKIFQRLPNSCYYYYYKARENARTDFLLVQKMFNQKFLEFFFQFLRWGGRGKIKLFKRKQFYCFLELFTRSAFLRSNKVF